MRNKIKEILILIGLVLFTAIIVALAWKLALLFWRIKFVFGVVSLVFVLLFMWLADLI